MYYPDNCKFTSIKIYLLSSVVLFPVPKYVHTSINIRLINLQQAASLEKVLKEQQQQQQFELERAWDQDRDIKGNGNTSPTSDHRVQEHSPPPATDAQKNINAAQPVTQVISCELSIVPRKLRVNFQ